MIVIVSRLRADEARLLKLLSQRARTAWGVPKRYPAGDACHAEHLCERLAVDFEGEGGRDGAPGGAAGGVLGVGHRWQLQATLSRFPRLAQ
ncbi:hypothetical protein ASL20_21020 [Cupriavidus necator]|nr:hypothetical protein ASL20_21020 [Cupriavidus necator]